MRRSYKSLRHFQEGWSSLQTRSRTSTNTHQGRRLQTRTLGNLQVRITSKMCSKTFHSTADNCDPHRDRQSRDNTNASRCSDLFENVGFVPLNPRPIRRQPLFLSPLPNSFLRQTTLYWNVQCRE